MEDVKFETYAVPGHGVVTLNRKKGMQFIGNKLSHMRKPSAYKGKKINSVSIYTTVKILMI